MQARSEDLTREDAKRLRRRLKFFWGFLVIFKTMFGLFNSGIWLFLLHCTTDQLRQVTGAQEQQDSGDELTEYTYTHTNTTTHF